MTGYKRRKKVTAPSVLRMVFVLIVLVTTLSGGVGIFPADSTVHAAESETEKRAENGVDWPMAGANPQRTSWTAEEVGGRLTPAWYKPIEPYIAARVQIIAAYGTLYISTARGLYALDAGTGDEKWVYPTELPLGHSPTVHNGRVYVGGFDHKIHSINAYTGQGIWTFEAEKGFQTNPLVIDIDDTTYIYAGNRDGYMYAVIDNGDSVELGWKYRTGGPVLFSAAYKDNTIYFASNDAYAYALDAVDGGLIWQSEQLPGSGFHSWWPVIYTEPQTQKDYVVLAGSNNYRSIIEPYPGPLKDLDRGDVFPDRTSVPRGTLVGPIGTESYTWVTGTPTIDVHRITNYFEEKPWRRTIYILEGNTGNEYTFDSDLDGKLEYAPILWAGTRGAGNRHPPVVGSDNVLYQQNVYHSDLYIPGGGIAGWKVGSSHINPAGSRWMAADEPFAFSSGGNLVYWNHCLDRSAGSIDISVPNISFPSGDSSREWVYWDYNLDSIIPGYRIMYSDLGVYGGINGVYRGHGDQNALIPYQGKVYVHRSNSVIALDASRDPPVALPLAETVDVKNANLHSRSSSQLRQELATEVEKILDAGHLRPGWLSAGLFDLHARSTCGENLVDYWHQPGETLLVLTQTLPHLPLDVQLRVKDYLQDEFSRYPPYAIVHTGLRDGAPREVFELPPEVEAERVNHPPTSLWHAFYVGWDFPPQMFYALWKYTEVFGNADQVFVDSQNRLGSVPDDSYLLAQPQVHNAYIAGYLGFLELEKLAGRPESSAIRAQLDRLLALRASHFSKDHVEPERDYCRTMSVARNFMFLVPELADYLRENALEKVQEALDEYQRITPYWFVSKFEATYGEGMIQPLYDYHALFQAKALLLQASHEDLLKYLDVPAVAVGDLYYLQNLITVIEASHNLEKEASSAFFPRQGDSIVYTLRLAGTNDALFLTDRLPAGVSTPRNLEQIGTTIVPTYDPVRHQLTWHDSPSAGQEVTICYEVTVTTSQACAQINSVELSYDGGKPITTTSTVLVNFTQFSWMPLVFRE